MFEINVQIKESLFILRLYFGDSHIQDPSVKISFNCAGNISVKFFIAGRAPCRIF